MKALLETLTHLSCRFAPLVLLCAIGLCALGLWVFLTRLAVVTDTDSMIDPTLPYRANYAAFQEAYPQLGDTVAVVITTDVPELAQRAAGGLAERLADDAENFASVYAPQTLDFFQDNGLLFLSEDALLDQLDTLIAAQPLLGPLLRTPSLAQLLESLAEAKEEGAEGERADLLNTVVADVAAVSKATLAGKPAILSLQAAMSDTSDPVILVVQPRLDPSKVNPAKAALGALRGHIAAVEAALPAPVDIALTGKIALNAEELKSVSSGAALAGGLSVLLVAIVLYWGTRSVRAALVMVVNLVAGLIFTGASALLIFGSLNIISVAFAVLFIGLGIDFAIHLLLRAQEAGPDAERADALRAAAGTSGLALALCAPTTALAFLSFTPTGYAGLAQLGVIAAIGVFIALATSMTLLPALIMFFKVPFKSAQVKASGAPSIAPQMVLIGTAVLLLPAGFFASKIGFSADPIRLKDPSSPSVIAYESLVARESFSPYVAHVTWPTADAAEVAQTKAKSLPAVGNAVWLGSFVPKDQIEKLDYIAEAYFLLSADLIAPDAAEPADIDAAKAAMQRLSTATKAPEFAAFLERAKDAPQLWQALSRRALETVPDLRATLQRQLTTDGVAADEVPDAIRNRYVGQDGSYRVELLPAEPIRTEQALKAHVEALRATFPDVTGSPVQIIGSGEVVQNAMVQATLTAFGLVSVFLLLLLRSLKQVAYILLPVFLAGIFMLGSAVLLGLQFNFANVIVLPLLLGLGVDAGIHFVRRAFEDDAVTETGSTGRAVLLSALTTIGSFGTLMVSSHAGTASMGQLLTLALICLLFTTLVVLPAVLRWRLSA
ncbi:MAG: MMPL family transporter [Pseudomonadota bacterium]